MHRLGRDFYTQPTEDVAYQLLGQRFVSNSSEGKLSGRIVEVEAYLAENDAACHAARGMTARNRSMFGPAGLLYVYSIHTRFCMNIVTGRPGQGTAVLVRAIEPDCGIDQMQRRRPVSSIRELTNGPGKLCQALGIDRSLDGVDLVTSERMWIEFVASAEMKSIRTSPRIGISQAKELPLRFFLDGHQFVSGRSSDHTIQNRWCWNEPADRSW